MKEKAAPKPSAKELHPVRVIGSIFRVRRDLTLLIKKHVLPGSGLTLEEADLLLDLFGAARLGWSDPPADEHEYVTFSALKASLVHSPSALSRRVASLQKAGLLEARKVHKIARDAKADRRSLALRITPAGVKRIEPVYRRYANLCQRLLCNVSSADQSTIQQVNDGLMEKARFGI